MPSYSENRRATAVPRLKAIGGTEAAETGELRRQQAIERDQEKLADELKKQHQGKGRNFADLVQPAPRRK